MPPEENGRTLGEAVSRLAGSMVKLDPGPLARLRRMDPAGPGEGDFWRLAVQHELRTDDKGLLFVRLLALLTPKGDPGAHKKLHDRDRPLGAALCEAGYPETRLLDFLALPEERRGEALERMARWLAAKGHGGVDCVHIARLLFFDSARDARHLAETYYRAQDKAQNAPHMQTEPDLSEDEAA
jgi:CRISPR system Cascade subunit CasB